MGQIRPAKGGLNSCVEELGLVAGPTPGTQSEELDTRCVNPRFFIFILWLSARASKMEKQNFYIFESSVENIVNIFKQTSKMENYFFIFNYFS